MIFPRDHRYLTYCNDCDWYEYVGRAPLRGQGRARRHAQRRPGHRTRLLDIDAVKVVTGFSFDTMFTHEGDAENSTPF